MSRSAIDAPLFLEEVGARLEERQEFGLVVRHGGDGVAELVGEATQHVGDEAAIRDGHVTVAEGVGQVLQAGEVLHDGEVLLTKTVELLEGDQAALGEVVQKEAADGCPESIGRGLVLRNHTLELLRDHGVQPTHDAPFNLGPGDIVTAVFGVDRAVDVVVDAVRHEESVEERAPEFEVGRVEVEGDWDLAMDVEGENGGEGNREKAGRGGERVGVRGAAGG